MLRNLESDPLWMRIRDFALDDPAAPFPLSRRLARENGWRDCYALRAIEEYRKFCFVAMRGGHSVTPSEDVDQVWHLHMIYTRSYWDEFCGKVLESPFHHGPTRGEVQDQANFRDWYQSTLNSYGRIFGVRPPADIWPPLEVRFRHAAAFRRVNTATHWVIPRPRMRLFAAREWPRPGLWGVIRSWLKT